MNLKVFIILFLCLGLNLNSQALNDSKEPIVTWSLQDLLRFAIENSPVITKAKQDKQQANLSEDKAKSFFLATPKITNNSWFQRSRTTSLQSTSNEYDDT